MEKRELFLLGKLFVATLAMTVAPAYGSAPGALDTTFGKGGIALGTLQNTSVTSILFQSNGDIIVVGMTTSDPAAVEAIGITRFLPNGAVDTRFGTNGITYVAFVNYYNWSIAAAVQSDDKIIVLAEVDSSTGNGVSNTGIARLNANGSLDTTFGQNGLVNLLVTNPSTGSALSTTPTGILVQTDGKIVVASGAGPLTAFLRFNPNGTLDHTFGQDGTEVIDVYGGSPGILSELTTSDLYTVAGSVIAQYSPSGALQPQVSGGTAVTTSIAKSIFNLPNLTQPDGKVLITEELGGGYDGLPFANQFIRFLPTGGVDWSFTNTPFASRIVDATVEPDDEKIVVVAAGPVSTDINLLRFNTDGSVDTTFGNLGTVSTQVSGGSASGARITMQPDNKILAAGSFQPSGSQTYVLVLARYLHQAH